MFDCLVSRFGKVCISFCTIMLYGRVSVCNAGFAAAHEKLWRDRAPARTGNIGVQNDQATCRIQ